MSRHTIFTCLLAVGLGLGLGWGVRRLRLASAATGEAGKQQAAAARASAKAPAATGTAAVKAADPGALERHFSTSRGALPWLELVALVESTPPSGFPRLLETCAGNETAWRLVAAQWASRDPQGMLSALAAVVPGRSGKAFGVHTQTVMEVLLGAWIKNDRAAAIAGARQLGGTAAWQDFRTSLASLVFESEPVSGLALMKEWNIANTGPSLKPVKKWFESDPAGALRAASEAGSLYAGRCVLAELGKLWAEKDPKAAFAAGAGLGVAGRREYDEAVAAAWGETNPKAVAAAIDAVTDPARRFHLGSGLVGVWAKKDPQAALDWAVEKFQGTARAEAVASVVGGLYTSNPGAVDALLASLQPGARAAAVGKVFTLRTEAGEKAATLLPWIVSLPDSNSQAMALGQAAWRLGQGDAGATAAAILEHASTPALLEHGHVLVQNIAASLARTQPEAALDWALKLPGTLKSHATDQAAYYWFTARPAAAQEHALAMPPGPERAQFVESLTYTLTGSLTGGSESEQAREQAGAWLSRLTTDEDRAAARAALARATLPAGDESAAAQLRQAQERLK